MGFGKELKKVLDECGVSVSKLAKDTGIPATTLYSIISRDIDRIDERRFSLITESLHVSIEKFIDNDGKYPFTIEIPLPDIKTSEGYNTPLDFEIDWIKNGGGAHPSYLGRKARVLVAFDKLTPDGQATAADRIEELTEIPKYRKNPEE